MRITSLTAFLALGSLSVMSAQTPIQRGQQYTGGSRIVSPATGVSFALPQQYLGAFDNEAELFLVVSRSNPNLRAAVWGYSEGTLEEILAVVAEQLTGLGINLNEKSSSSMTQKDFSGWYYAATDEGTGLLYAAAQKGAPGNSMVVAALGAQEEEAKLEPLVKQILESVQFSTPGAAAWKQQVGGTAFVRGASADEYSPGGAGSGSYASQEDASLDLCSNGQYAYQMKSESYMSVAGAGSVSREESDQHTGQWWLVADLIGDAYLVLEATDGRYFQWKAQESQQGGYLINDESYAAHPSQRCR